MFTAIHKDLSQTTFKDLSDLNAGLADGRLQAGDVIYPDPVFDVIETGLTLEPLTAAPAPLNAVKGNAPAAGSIGLQSSSGTSTKDSQSQPSSDLLQRSLKLFTDSRDIDKEGPDAAGALLFRQLIDSGIEGSEASAIVTQVKNVYIPRG